MPIYEYLCPTHGRFTGWATIGDRHQAQTCAECGVAAPFVISAPRVFCDFPAYVSPASGRVIEGRRARLEDMKQTGCRPYEEGEMKDAEDRRKLLDAKLDAEVDAAVEQTLVELKNG